MLSSLLILCLHILSHQISALIFAWEIFAKQNEAVLPIRKQAGKLRLTEVQRWLAVGLKAVALKTVAMILRVAPRWWRFPEASLRCTTVGWLG